MDHFTMCLSQRQKAAHISYFYRQVDLVPLPHQQFCWVTFFSHPADKGREVMLEYNERAAVSRIIIPALIEQWSETHPALYNRWVKAKTETRPPLDDLQQSLMSLPEASSFAQLERELPEAFRQC